MSGKSNSEPPKTADILMEMPDKEYFIGTDACLSGKWALLVKKLPTKISHISTIFFPLPFPVVNFIFKPHFYHPWFSKFSKLPLVEAVSNLPLIKTFQDIVCMLDTERVTKKKWQALQTLI